jgi:cytochrome c biogenesis protein CcmG/thiol:disulfide interchange protein DsbE
MSNPMPATPTDQPHPPGRRRRTLIGAAVVAALAVIVVSVVSALSVGGKNIGASLTGSALIGRPAPGLAGETVTGGHASLAAYRGRWVIVNFFASWCVPCQEEGYELEAFQFDHLRTGDASVLGVVFNDNPGAARDYQARLGATWPTMADPNQAIALAYGARQDPTSFVIAPNGRVVTAIFGGVTAVGLDRILARAEARGYGR